MAGNCAIFRSWNTGDLLTASDLTTSFTTVGVTNLTPACMDDYALDVTQFRATTDPYPASVASLPTSLAGELERIRFVIKKLTGWSQWYAHTESLAGPFDLIPAADATYKIGSSSFRWTQGFFSGSLVVGGSNPAASGALRVPNNNTVIAARNAANSADITLAVDSGDNWTFNARLSPSADATLDLGLSTFRFRDIFASSSLRVGSTVASAGSLRLANNSSVGWRNAANSADHLLTLDGSNFFTFTSSVAPSSDNAVDLGSSSLRWRDVYSSSSVRVGTNPAGTGAIRLANNVDVVARNAANSADISLMKLDSSNNFLLSTAGGAHVMPGIDASVDLGATGARWRDVFASSSFRAGTNPAAAGLIRLANAGNISGRNAANGADVVLASIDSSDRVRLGPGSTGNIRMDGQVRCDIDTSARLVLPVGADKWAV